MDRWEYKVVMFTADASISETRLNNYGASGWELVSIGGRFAEAQYAYLKRRHTPPPS